MTDKDKIILADLMMDFIMARSEDKKSIPQMVGTLKTRLGLNGFKEADPGTPVFDNGDRYFIMLESLDGKRNVEVGYYKETLKDYINFGENLNP